MSITISSEDTAHTVSVLAKASASMVRSYPFPHLVIENALDPETYLALASTFPQRNLFLEGASEESNRYYWLQAKRVLNSELLNANWTEFVRFHTSREFFHDVLRVFEDAINELHPSLVLKVPLRNWTTGIRHLDATRDITLECQPTYCSPVYEATSRSRGPHLDREVALFAGLLYMRKPEDVTIGGDFVIHETRLASSSLLFDAGNHIPDAFVHEFSIIPYKANTLVFFINSSRSIHGVTPREKTCHPRLHVNFVGQLLNPIFSISKPQSDTTNINAWYGNR